MPSPFARLNRFHATAQNRQQRERVPFHGRLDSRWLRILFILTVALSARGDEPGTSTDRHTVHGESTMHATLGNAAFLTVHTLDEFAARSRELRETATPASPDEVRQSVDEIGEASQLVDFIVSDFGRFESQWRTFLCWEPWQQQLSSNSPDMDVLDRISRRLEAATPMVKEPLLREAARRLSHAARIVRSAGTSQEEIDAAFERLTEQLEQLRDDPEALDSSSLGRTLGWLYERNLALPLVTELRQHFCRPNLYITAGLESIAEGVNQSISDRVPVRDTILGTRYRGWSDVESQIRLILRPDDDQIAMVFQLDTTAHSSTTGRKGDARVSSRSTTEIQGQKEILIDADGFQTLPAEATGTSTSRITGFSWYRLFGYVAARQQAFRLKPATDREVASRAQLSVQQELDRQVADMIAPLQHDYLHKVRLQMVLRGLVPDPVRFESQGDSLSITATEASPLQLTTASEPPVRHESDVAIEIHTSLINNTAETLLGGKTFGEEQWSEPFVAIFGSSPEAVQMAHPERPWSISFEERQPLEIQLDRQSFTLLIRARRLQVGDELFPPVEIGAKYQLADQEPGLVCRRDGPLQVVLSQTVPGQNLGLRQQVFRSMVRKRFDPIFASEIRIDRLPLPTSWSGVGAVRITSVEATGQWLHFACVRDAPSTDVPATTTASNEE